MSEGKSDNKVLLYYYSKDTTTLTDTEAKYRQHAKQLADQYACVHKSIVTLLSDLKVAKELYDGAEEEKNKLLKERKRIEKNIEKKYPWCPCDPIDMVTDMELEEQVETDIKKAKEKNDLSCKKDLNEQLRKIVSKHFPGKTIKQILDDTDADNPNVAEELRDNDRTIDADNLRHKIELLKIAFKYDPSKIDDVTAEDLAFVKRFEPALQELVTEFNDKFYESLEETMNG